VSQNPADSLRVWRYVRGLAPPLVLFSLLLGALVYALRYRLHGEDQYDRLALREWVQESRVFRHTLPELVREYLEGPADPELRRDQRDSIREHLAALGEVTRDYQTQLPLFPVIYGLEVRFYPEGEAPIRWDSRLPTGQVQISRTPVELYESGGRRAEAWVDYQLHAYAQRQEELAARESRLRAWLSLLAIAAAVVAVLWVMVFLRSERGRELERYRAQRALDLSQQQALEEQLRRQAAEHEREESERRLLEQKIATQDAERQALALKSQLYANISIMAASYAHNIKNLMVRPGDLVQRLLQQPGQSSEAVGLLKEVQHSLQNVTERTQQILKTVRSDPTQAQPGVVDLNDLLLELDRTWTDMALQKWKARLIIQPNQAPLLVRADRSHLLQAAENLLFNARDATFERRAALRDEARQQYAGDAEARRRALIAAAEWQGEITAAVRREGQDAVLSVRDNGAGMTPQVQERCVETEFTTKRGSALYEGANTGMGLGLAFVKATLEQHGGRLWFSSTPGLGSTFEIRLPALDNEDLRAFSRSIETGGPA
jgi:signal transduction histidine kinase